jgi:hypothetical protein
MEVRMQEVPMELFSNASNLAIVRTPGRQFPGIVVQGDSLHNLCESARSVVLGLTSARSGGAPGLDEVLEEAEDLLERLQDRVDAYEECLRTHGIKLPY